MSSIVFNYVLNMLSFGHILISYLVSTLLGYAIFYTEGVSARVLRKFYATDGFYIQLAELVYVAVFVLV